MSGVEYSYIVEATGGSRPYFWVVEGSLPEGLELSTEGVIAGIPAVATNSSVSIRVSDSSGRSSSVSYNLTVSVGEERQTIQARGGIVIIDIDQNILKFFESIPNAGFTDYLIFSSTEKVQVHFIGDTNQIPSWVLCETTSASICSFN